MRKIFDVVILLRNRRKRRVYLKTELETKWMVKTLQELNRSYSGDVPNKQRISALKMMNCGAC